MKERVRLARMVRDFVKARAADILALEPRPAGSEPYHFEADITRRWRYWIAVWRTESGALVCAAKEYYGDFRPVYLTETDFEVSVSELKRIAEAETA